MRHIWQQSVTVDTKINRTKSVTVKSVKLRTRKKGKGNTRIKLQMTKHNCDITLARVI